MRGEHLVRVAAERRAAMPVGASAQAAAISRAAARGEARPRPPAESAPATAAAVSSPTLWPAATPSGRPAGSSSSAAAASAGATSSGWVTAVSLISSASAVGAEPGQVEAGDARTASAAGRRRRGRSSHGASMPGVWAPWPGARRASTPPPLRVRSARRHECDRLRASDSLPARPCEVILTIPAVPVICSGCPAETHRGQCRAGRGRAPAGA